MQREVQGWLAEEQRWVTLSAVHEYSEHEHPFRFYADGVERSIVYDEADVYPVTEIVEPTPNRSLTWSLQWDYTRGVCYIDRSQ